jgi:glycosyltransferase 2 family protein
LGGLGFLISLGLLVFVLARTDIGRSWGIILTMRGRGFIVPLFATGAALGLRGWRWQMIFPQARRPGVWPCFRVLAIGNLANYFFPGRAGDVMRCFLISREHLTTTASLTLATVGLEKILDGLLLMAVLASASFLFNLPPWVSQLTLAAGVVFGGGILAATLFRGHALRGLDALRARLKGHLSGTTERLATIVERLTDGLSAIGSSRQIAWLVLLSLGVWTAEAGLVWGLAQGAGVPLSPVGSAVVAAILGLGLSIPAGPGFIGTYEFFSVAGLGLFGVESAVALGLTLAMHAWVLLTTALTGLGAMTVSGLSWSQMLVARTQGR